MFIINKNSFDWTQTELNEHSNWWEREEILSFYQATSSQHSDYLAKTESLKTNQNPVLSVLDGLLFSLFFFQLKIEIDFKYFRKIYDFEKHLNDNFHKQYLETTESD